jgi:hypothetical protein
MSRRFFDHEYLVVGVATFIVLAVGGTVWRLSGDPELALGVLGGLAVFFAAIQFADARRTIRGLEGIGGELSGSTQELGKLRGALDTSTERLEGQLSTRWIGTFPDFLPRIAELIGTAEKNVVILCDFPAYGEFSAPEAYARYAEVIRKKAHLPIELLCLDDDPRWESIREQLSKGGWESWRSSNQSLIRNYLTARGRDSSEASVIDLDDLVELLGTGDEGAMKEDFAATRKWVTTLVMPIYFWIVDGERAIFSLAPLMDPGEGDLEVGFQTLDRSLVNALEGIFLRYRDASQTSRR